MVHYITVGKIVIAPLIMMHILVFSVVFAQEERVEPPEPPPLLSPPRQVYESEKIAEFEDSPYPAYAVYNIYGRVIKLVQDFPFGYYAVTEYTWWPNNYREEQDEQGSYSYDNRKKEEIGYLYKNGKQSAYYEFTYDEEETIVAKKSEGASIIRTLIFLLAPILRVTNQEIAENEEIKKLLDLEKPTAQNTP